MTSEPMRDALAEGRVLPFRRRAFSARRKRRPLWLLLGAPLAGALAIVGAPAVLALWVLQSSRFALVDVVVEAGPRVPRGWVLEALSPLVGSNLVRLRLHEVRARLEAHPWFESAELGKELPRRLRIRVHERQAAALLRSGAALAYVDAEGRVIAPWAPPIRLGAQPPIELGAQPQGEEDLLLLAAPADVAPAELVAAMALASRLERAAPAWAAALSEVELLGEEEFRLTSAALPFPVVVRASTLEASARRLQELLPQISRRYPRVGVVDLRSERRIVIEPAAVPAKPGTSARPQPSGPDPAAARAAA